MSESAINQILDSARMLWAAKDKLTLDEADGEFYWRHCPGELVHSLRKLSLDGDESPEGTASVIDQLYRLEQAMPGLSSWISANRSPRMRDPLIAWAGSRRPQVPVFARQHQEAGSEAWFCLGVRNSQWRGEDVENAYLESVEALVAQGISGWYERSGKYTDEDSAFMAASFRFYGAGKFAFESDWVANPTDKGRVVRVESPLIMCNITYPFPPKGVITSLYDAIVIGQHQWHTRLYGFGATKRQQVDTAIRTWAIGLLIGMGMKQRDAVREVFAALELAGDLADAHWTVDRQILVARVPEAEAFVYSPTRKRKPKPDCGQSTY